MLQIQFKYFLIIFQILGGKDRMLKVIKIKITTIDISLTTYYEALAQNKIIIIKIQNSSNVILIFHDYHEDSNHHYPPHNQNLLAQLSALICSYCIIPCVGPRHTTDNSESCICS